MEHGSFIIILSSSLKTNDNNNDIVVKKKMIIRKIIIIKSHSYLSYILQRVLLNHNIITYKSCNNILSHHNTSAPYS